MRLILASASEWRKNLMEWLQLPFDVVVAEVDEDVFPDEEASELVARLAVSKAEKVARQLPATRHQIPDEEGILIIGADTIIELDNQLIGKPANRQDAEEIVGQMAGRAHEVWTGVCVVDPITGERRVETERTVVTVGPITDKQMKAYLDTGEWIGKAGAYQIQGAMAKHITDLEGSYTNVIGLPLLLVQDFLESMGAMVEVDVPEVIRQKTGRQS